MTRISAVGMLRNEADIVESFVRHTLTFVDEVRLVDHLSTDRTPQILEKLQGEGLPLQVERYSGNARIQEILTTRLAQEAFAAGAEWVIPLDCDEFIDAPDPARFRMALDTLKSDRIAWWPWISMVPGSTDDDTEIDPVRRIRKRLATEREIMPKCLVHRGIEGVRGWQLAPGNHHVRRQDLTPLPMVKLPEQYALRHFPIRSLDQLMSKMVLGRLAWAPRLKKGSRISFHTRDFVERLKTGWQPTQDDLTAYAGAYQSPEDNGQNADLLDAPLHVEHDLRYTNHNEAAFLPRLLAWAEHQVEAERGTAPPAVFVPPASARTSPVPKRSYDHISPQAADAFNKANAAWRAGNVLEALQHAQQAAGQAPELVEAHILKARAFRRLGDDGKARAAYADALSVDPDNFDALLECGNVLRVLEDPNAASESYTKAMQVRTDDPRPALALARLWEEQPGQDAAERAATAFQRALDRANSGSDPALATAGLCRDLARFRMDRGDLPRALDSLRQARSMAGQGGLASQIDLLFAEVYLRLGMMDEAQVVMEQLSASRDADMLRSLANLADWFNFWAEAVAILKRRRDLRPDDADVHLDLADMQVKAWLLEEALISLDRAEAAGAVASTASAALRASIANRTGDAQTALSLYESLVAEGQNSFAPNAAMSLLYADSVTPAEVARRHRAMFSDWGREARTSESFRVDRKAERPIRVGLVTGDLHHQHPVNIFMQPLLARWDHDRLPLTVFYTGQTVDDQTRLARSRVGTWRNVTASDLPAVVEADRIDVLIDLAGHTSGRTMRAFARRMAPVQASFLGYPGSTGVPNIDWLIGDPIVTPPEDDHLCSERVMRLPNTVFCFAPEVEYPLPDFEDLAQSCPLTFGSFNNIPKLTPHTICLWANVLKAVPDARLLLRAPSFKDAGAITRFRKLFGDHDITSDRLIFKGPVALDEMMHAYSEIDIALDPTPYCGGTTTLQALWMGVPVLTLRGGHFVSRMGASLMTAAGLSDWVAERDEDYVALAQKFASDRKRLTSLKAGLRSTLLDRPAWDADIYARDFMNAIAAMHPHAPN